MERLARTLTLLALAAPPASAQSYGSWSYGGGGGTTCTPAEQAFCMCPSAKPYCWATWMGGDGWCYATATSSDYSNTCAGCCTHHDNTTVASPPPAFPPLPPWRPPLPGIPANVEFCVIEDSGFCGNSGTGKTRAGGSNPESVYECWQLCKASTPGLVAVDFWPNSYYGGTPADPICFCQTSCTASDWIDMTQYGTPTWHFLHLAVLPDKLPASAAPAPNGQSTCGSSGSGGSSGSSSGCQDSATYADPEYSSTCAEWAGYDCNGYAYSADLMANCPVACAVPCTSAPPPPPRCGLQDATYALTASVGFFALAGTGVVTGNQVTFDFNNALNGVATGTWSETPMDTTANMTTFMLTGGQFAGTHVAPTTWAQDCSSAQVTLVTAFGPAAMTMKPLFPPSAPPAPAVALSPPPVASPPLPSPSPPAQQSCVCGTDPTKYSTLGSAVNCFGANDVTNLEVMFGGLPMTDDTRAFYTRCSDYDNDTIFRANDLTNMSNSAHHPNIAV